MRMLCSWQACLHLLQASPNASMTLVDHLSNKAYFGAFGVAKAGMRAYCDIMAAEHDNLQKFIRINTVEPGAMRTGFRTLHYRENPNETARPEALVRTFLIFIKLGRRQTYRRAYCDCFASGVRYGRAIYMARDQVYATTNVNLILRLHGLCWRCISDTRFRRSVPGYEQIISFIRRNCSAICST